MNSNILGFLNVMLGGVLFTLSLSRFNFKTFCEYLPYVHLNFELKH